jgi:hypothetical protein
VVAVPLWWSRFDFVDKIRYDWGGQLVGLPSLELAAFLLVAVFALLAILSALVWRHDRTAPAVASALSATSIPASIIALSRLTIGPTLLSPAHVRWIWPLAVFITISCLWSALELRHVKTREQSDRSATFAVVALVSALSLLNLPYHDEQFRRPQSEYAAMPALRRVFPQLPVLRGHDPVLFVTSNLRFGEHYSSAVMMQMRELGIEFRTNDVRFTRQLGPTRLATGKEDISLFQLEGLAAHTYAGPACTIALSSALTMPEEQVAGSAAWVLSSSIVNGTLPIDAERLTDSLERWMLGAALAGDYQAAWGFVVNGTLARWLEEGIADAGETGAIKSAVDLVGRWISSSYGLFAEGLDPCPERSEDAVSP